MQSRSSLSSAFTIVEVLIVVVIIGILAAIGIASFTSVQQQARNSQRAADMQVLAEALEKYRDTNGEYPSCSMMRENPEAVTAFLPGLDTATLRAPLAPESTTNSISCINLADDGVDQYAYLGDGTEACSTGSSCSGFILRYREEGGTTKDVRSRHNSNLAGIDSPGYASAEWTVFSVDTTTPGCTGSYTLPISSTSAPGTMIDWGDGQSSTTAPLQRTHAYDTPGVYYIRYNGTIINMNGSTTGMGSRHCLRSIQQWGNLAAPVSINYISGQGLSYVADLPSSVTSMQGMFQNASTYNQSIDNWDTSNVTNMGQLFMNATAFNRPIGDWDTSKVTEMSQLFYGASTFNQPIGDWDTSSARQMTAMLYNARSFNQPLGSWNTSNVIGMSQMFYGALTFNQDLSAWNVSAVTPQPPTSFRTGANAWTLPKPGTGW